MCIMFENIVTALTKEGGGGYKLGLSVLTLRQAKKLLVHYFLALGCTCNFDLRSKKNL